MKSCKSSKSIKTQKTTFQDFNDNETLFKQFKADLTIKKHTL